MSKIEIGRQIAEIHNLVHRHIQKKDVCCENDEKAGLSHSNVCIIGYLYDNKSRDVFQRDLEREFKVRRSTMSKVLSLLQAKGYVTRQDVENDRRLKKIVLTQKAELLADTLKQQRLTLEEVMVGSISQEELTSFCKTCEKIKQNLLQEEQS